MSATALALIAPAFSVLNVFQPGESIPSAQSSMALGFLNRMMSGWQQVVIPVVAREVFDTVADQGGPSNPYTIGSGGDFDTERPPSQMSVKGAGLLQYPGQSNEVEIPRGILTDDGWEAIQVKTLTNSQWTNVYYNPTYDMDMGTINLWPIPDSSDYDLVLYLAKPFVEFADLSTTTYYFPPGVEKAIVDNLVLELAEPWGAQISPNMEKRGLNSLGVVKRSNLKLTDLPSDCAMTTDRRYGFNIYTGNM